MPIGALPQTTVRAIGSTSVISDPCAVVKELLDNALDASASSLQIEISQNTVDVIQLKDNGHGISTEDHPNVCKHAFTSKIETVDDLRNVGGTSFGFRGEALASVAEMSGAVTITTRTASEVTATSLIYGRDGELTGCVLLSAIIIPVSLHTNINQFYSNFPPCRDDCSHLGLSQAHPSPQTNSTKGSHQDSRHAEEASSRICLCSALQEVLAQSSQSQE